MKKYRCYDCNAIFTFEEISGNDTDIIYCSNCGHDTLLEVMDLTEKKDLKQIIELLEKLNFIDEYIDKDTDGSFVAFTKDTISGSSGKYQLIKVYKGV